MDSIIACFFFLKIKLQIRLLKSTLVVLLQIWKTEIQSLTCYIKNNWTVQLRNFLNEIEYENTYFETKFVCLIANYKGHLAIVIMQIWSLFNKQISYKCQLQSANFLSNLKLNEP